MADIPDEVLEKIKCSICDYYLSTKPVMLKPTGENVCGRCVQLEDINQFGVRNEAYEHLAGLVMFPCRYDKEGCQERMLFDEIKKHEAGCPNQPYECPLSALDECDWTGKPNNLKKHYQEEHPSLVVGHPYKFHPNISTNNLNCILTEVMNYLFLVQIQCNMAAAKLWYCVRFIGNPKFASLFEFTLDMDYQSGKLIQKKDVQSFERLLLVKNDVIEVDITGLLKIVGGADIRNINTSIQVTLKNQICLLCHKNNTNNPVYLDDNGYYCSQCIEDKTRIKCKNNKACNYEDMKLNMQKHELWLCKYTKTLCRKNACGKQMLHNRESLIDHITREHITDELAYYPSFSGQLLGNTLYGAVLYIHDSKLVTNCVFNDEGFKYTIVSNLSKLDTLKYKCMLKVVNMTTNESHETELKRDLLSMEYDWITIIRDDNLLDLDGNIPKMYKCQIAVTIDPNFTQ